MPQDNPARKEDRFRNLERLDTVSRALLVVGHIELHPSRVPLRKAVRLFHSRNSRSGRARLTLTIHNGNPHSGGK